MLQRVVGGRELHTELHQGHTQPVHSADPGTSCLCPEGGLVLQGLVQSFVPSAVCEYEEPFRDAISELFGLYTAAIGDGFQRYRASDGSFPENLGELSGQAITAREPYMLTLTEGPILQPRLK